jgi:hypothetical protein
MFRGEREKKERKSFIERTRSKQSFQSERKVERKSGGTTLVLKGDQRP